MGLEHAESRSNRNRGSRECPEPRMAYLYDSQMSHTAQVTVKNIQAEWIVLTLRFTLFSLARQVQMISELPIELIQEISGYLLFGDLIVLASTCHSFHYLLKDGAFGKHSTLLVGLDSIQCSKLGQANASNMRFDTAITQTVVNEYHVPLMNVTVLSNEKYHDIDSKCILLLAPKLLNLREINLAWTALKDTDLGLLLRSCCNLIDINLSRCSSLTSVALCLIATSCPIIQSVAIDYTRCATNQSLAILFAQSSLSKLSMACAPLVCWDLVDCLIPDNLLYLRLDSNPLTCSLFERILTNRKTKCLEPLCISAMDCDQLTGREIAEFNSNNKEINIIGNSLLWDHDSQSVKNYIRQYIIGDPEFEYGIN